MSERGYWNRAARRSGGYRPRTIVVPRVTSDDATHSAACAVLNRHDACDFPACKCECHAKQDNRDKTMTPREYHPSRCRRCVERIFDGSLVYNPHNHRYTSAAQRRFIMRGRIERLREGLRSYI
jgi:hypothetical protein